MTDLVPVITLTVPTPETTTPAVIFTPVERIVRLGDLGIARENLAGTGFRGEFGDISALPSAAVERVDVLLDGASALYGADAVAGVVNVVMRKAFNGQESRARVSLAEGGAEDFIVSHLAGRSWSTGSAYLSYEYQTSNPLSSLGRNYTATGDLRPFGGTDHRALYSVPGNILTFNAAAGAYVAQYAIRPNASGTAQTAADFVAGGANLQAISRGVDLTPSLERHSAYGRIRQSIGDRLELTADVRYNRRTYEFAGAASIGVFNVTRSNPYFVSPTGAASHMGQRPSRTVMQAEAGVAFAEKPVPSLALTLLDVTTGARRILATGALKDFSIAPGGRRLALVEGGELVPVQPETIVQMDTPTRQRLSFVDLDTGRTTALEPSLDIAPHLLRWSQNGREVLVWARHEGDTWTDGALFRIGGARSISAVPRGDLLVRPASGGIDTLRGVQADWMGDIPVLYARRPDNDRFDWYALEDTTPLPLTAFLAAPAGRIAAVMPRSVLMFGDGALWRGDGSGLHRVTAADQSVAEVVIGDIEKPFRLKINDAPRQDWVSALAPDGVDLGIAAGGLVSPLAQRSQTPDARVLAATRTAALVLRHEGLVETLSVRADFYVRSVDAAVDAALEAHPELPGDRIAVMGHSFGGYVALAIATRSSRYRSYISWAGMSEMFSQWGEFVPVTRSLAEDRHMMRNQQGWLETGQGGLNGPPWNDIQGYVDSSPYLAADRISAPVMMITADRDFVPMSQAELMFSARYRLGGKARLVTYWGEDHAVWSPANIRDLYEQVFDWLDDTLAIPVGVRPGAQDALPTSAPSPQTQRRP